MKKEDAVSDVISHYYMLMFEKEVRDKLSYSTYKKVDGMLRSLSRNSKDWPFDKSNRWIGFIQGIFYSHDLLNVEKERIRTRPIYHEYYMANGIDIPESETVD